MDNSLLLSRFLAYTKQWEIIGKGVAVFKELFGFTSQNTVAPDYCWNSDTEKVW